MYDQNLPIDIHCTKLVDWLVQRRHCKRDWGEKLSVIRKKIRSALQDMPEHEDIKQLLSDARIDYFKSVQIVDILKTTEASSKNIFGYYSSQRIKDWQEIVTLYERDCVYMAEISTNLIREVNYEIPGARKNISRCHKEIEDLEKERVNLLKQSQHFKNEYSRMAQAYGIKGIDIIGELENEMKLLPNVLKNIVEATKNLAPALECYRQFACSTCKNSEQTFAPIIGHVLEKGNTTLYEYKHGVEPESLELPQATSVRKVSASQTSNVSNEEEIDFGEDATSSESSSGFVHLNPTESVTKDTEIDDEIDFGDTTAIDMNDSVTTCVDLVLEENSKVARGEEARTILDAKTTRSEFINELYELEAFIGQRLFERTNEAQSTSYLSDDSSRGRHYDQSELTDMLTKIKDVLEIINVGRNKALFQMRDSPEFVERIVERLNAKLSMAEKRLTKHAMCKEQIDELSDQLKELELVLRKSVDRGRKIQNQVESALSELYRGRRVNIMGGLS